MAKTVITETKTRAVDTLGGSAADVVRVVVVSCDGWVSTGKLRDLVAALDAADVPNGEYVIAKSTNEHGWIGGLQVAWRTRRELAQAAEPEVDDA